MKILIDAYQYSSHITGTDRMAKNFLSELQKIDTDNKYYIITSKNYTYISSSLESKNFKPVHRLNPKTKLGKVLHRITGRLEGMYFHWIIKPDVYFSFHNMAAPHFNFINCKIGSVLDLIPILFKEYETTKDHSKEAYIARYRQMIEQTDQFMAISNYSKQDLHKHLSVPLNDIEVIHLATDPDFKLPPASEVKKIKAKYKLPENFIFALGCNEPRKNVQVIVDSFEYLPSSIKKDLYIVIGGKAWRGHSTENLEKPFTKLLGFIDEEDLSSIYSLAKLHINPSKYEGFGFSTLESMACNVPVISAHGSSLDEVGGDAVVYFDPLNPRDLAKKIEQVLTDSKLASALVEKGHRQNASFSWATSARKLHNLLIGVK